MQLEDCIEIFFMVILQLMAKAKNHPLFILRMISIGFILLSIFIWYFLFATPLHSSIAINHNENFSSFYGNILFLAIPTVAFLVFQKILEKTSDLGLFICSLLAGYINLFIWILNPDNIYKWYNDHLQDVKR